MSDTLHADVVIVGGGLAGLPLAIACAGAGIRTAVIEREAPAAMVATPFDGRTTAIAYGSQQILAGLGIWDRLAAGAQPILDIRVADRGSPLFLHYDHRDVGDAPFGWIVENRDFRAALLEALAELPDLLHLTPATVLHAECGPERVDIALADGRTIRGRLLVAADGKASPLRQQAGIRTIGRRYAQHSIVCTVAHETPHEGIAVEHFLPAGPFAILPMTGNRSSIVWTEAAAVAPSMMALDDAAFEAELGRRFGDFLGGLKVVGPRWSYPLDIMLAERMVADRLALVGDAAHVIHPIAGQGLNLGIRDVAALAEVLIDTCRLGLDPGAPDVLARYQRRRRIDTAVMATATDGLNRLFSNSIEPLRLARDLGLALVDRTPPVKRFFMRHAMGLIGASV